MIENRFRLEREILRGRQAVRRSTQMRDRTAPSEEMSSLDPGNTPDTSRGPPISPDSALIEQSEPGQNDTDTDLPFRYDARDGKLRLRYRHVNDTEEPNMDSSGTNTPAHLKSSHDPLRSHARRRVWTSHLLEDEGEAESVARSVQDYGFGSPDPPIPLPTPGTSPTASFLHLPHLRTGGLLRKLRPKSFPSFPSPFQSFRKLNRESIAPEQGADDAWSSDSSDLEDDLDEGGFQPFGLDSREEDEDKPISMTSSQEL